MLPLAHAGSPDELLLIGSVVAAVAVYRLVRGPKPAERKAGERSDDRPRSRNRA